MEISYYRSHVTPMAEGQEENDDANGGGHHHNQSGEKTSVSRRTISVNDQMIT